MCKTTHKTIVLILVLALYSTFFAGCRAQDSTAKQPGAGEIKQNTAQTQTPPAQTPPAQTPTSQTPAATTAPGQPEPLKLPIVQKPVTLTYWVNMDTKMSATLKSYGEMLLYQELEKKTGIKIEFLHPPANQASEQFNLMLASRDLPDLIEWGWINVPGGPEKALQDGVIIELNDFINKHAPNFKALMTKQDEARKDIITDSGKYYMLPNLYIDVPMRIMIGFQGRKDWLDKMNLNVLATIDEWYTVLKAFKEKDPNGNGKADEIPLIAEKLRGTTGLANLTCGWGMPYGFYILDGKVKCSFIEPDFKDFLTTMNTWYKEGLIDPDFASTDKKAFDAKVTDSRAGFWSAYLMGDLGRYLMLMEKQTPEAKLVGLPFPKDRKTGIAFNFTHEANKVTNGNGTAITTKNKYPVESIKWMDYCYSDEGHLLYNFGVEGKTYNMVNGYPKFTDLIMKNPQGWSVDQAIGHYARGNSGTGPHVADPRSYEQRASTPVQQAAKNLWASGDKTRTMVNVTPTGEESQRTAAIMSEVNTYTDEMVTKFIMGQEPIDKFDQYVANLKKMGIEEAVKIQQAALDRYKQRK